MSLNLELATQLARDFKMVNIVSHWLAYNVDYFKLESRKLHLF